MSVTHNNTLADLERLIADLQRQPVECQAERDEALGERDKTQRRLAERDEPWSSKPRQPKCCRSSIPRPAILSECSTRFSERRCGFARLTSAASIPTTAVCSMAAMRGVPVAFAEYRRNNPPKYGPGTGATRMLAGGRLVHHLNLIEAEAYRRGDPNSRALVELGGFRGASRHRDGEHHHLGELRQRTDEVAELNRRLEFTGRGTGRGARARRTAPRHAATRSSCATLCGKRTGLSDRYRPGT